MALNGLQCADVPLRNCSLTHWYEHSYYGAVIGNRIYRKLYATFNDQLTVAPAEFRH